ncbi:MAG TPA: GNAT family N-acetyltransferase, partial [Chthonomonadaceae bacterium]|nr:GNAT family N-acetyltransferase [Chthonomonadaceae bacterium]
MDGPRGVCEQDMASLRALTGIVMRPELVDQYPQLFNPANYENLRVCADGEKLVAHVGMTQRNAILYDCRIRTACIGGVCTLPEYRKQGLASACFDDALRKARAEGVDLMIVSGDRNLYRMRGCVHVGGDTEYEIGRHAVPSGWR